MTAEIKAKFSQWACIVGITGGIFLSGQLKGQDNLPPEMPQLVLKEVLLPHSNIPGEDLAFGPPLPLKDFDVNGFPNFAVTWSSFDSIGGSTTGARVFVGDWSELRAHQKWRGHTVESSFTSNYYPLTTRIVLDVGGEPFLTYKDGLDLKAASLVGRGKGLNFTPPPPSTQFESISISGDVSGDGKDDFFFYASNGQPYVLAGLFNADGNSPIWLHQDSSRQVHSSFPVRQINGGPTIDVNLDGVEDFILAYKLPWSGGNNPFDIYYVALSGADGHVLWETELGTQSGISAHTLGEDLNGDYVPDIIRLGWIGVDYWSMSYTDLGVIEAVSGMDGSIIWSKPSYQIDPNWRTGPNLDEGYQASRSILPCPDLTGDGVADVLCGAMLLTPAGQSNGMGFGLFSGANGEFVKNFEFPPSVYPWSLDELGKGSSEDTAVSLGDLDKDGWPELAYLFDAPSLDNDGDSRTVPRGLAILSIPSLITPRVAKTGSAFPCRIQVPAAPNGGFTILGSSSYSVANGFGIGTWDTLLGASRLLDLTKRTSTIHSLDSLGSSEFLITIPNGSWFVGSTLFLRAIIFSTPAYQPPQTISNLNWVAIE